LDLLTNCCSTLLCHPRFYSFSKWRWVYWPFSFSQPHRMTMLYNIDFSRTASNGCKTVLVSFGDVSSNDEIVKEVAHTTSQPAFKEAVMGNALLIDGPASLIVAMALAHAVCHICPAVAGFDPKLGSYVVAISHDPKYPVGMLIPKEK
jgi:CRISPR-associated protein Csx3